MLEIDDKIRPQLKIKRAELDETLKSIDNGIKSVRSITEKSTFSFIPPSFAIHIFIKIYVFL